jgi:hypothetical protein
LTPKEGDRTYVTVSPWPFREPTVPLTVEGRALTGRFPDEAALRVNLPRAPWATLSLHLLA